MSHISFFFYTRKKKQLRAYALHISFTYTNGTFYSRCSGPREENDTLQLFNQFNFHIVGERTLRLARILSQAKINFAY